jgi:hypothetical protein
MSASEDYSHYKSYEEARNDHDRAVAAGKRAAAHERYVGDIATWFGLHSPKTPEIGERMDRVRSWYKNVARLLEEVPEGRERSEALTHLEQSLFFAIAAIARSKENL